MSSLNIEYTKVLTISNAHTGNCSCKSLCVYASVLRCVFGLLCYPFREANGAREKGKGHSNNSKEHLQGLQWRPAKGCSIAILPGLVFHLFPLHTLQKQNMKEEKGNLSMYVCVCALYVFVYLSEPFLHVLLTHFRF